MELDARQVAAILQVPEYSVYRLVAEDNLPARRINGQYRFSREELVEWAHSRSVNSVGFVNCTNGKSALVSLAASLAAGGLQRQVSGGDKAAVLRSVVEHLPLHQGADRAGLLEVLLAREKGGATLVGNGIAIPHSRFPVVLPVGQPLLTLCYLERPVSFGTGTLGQVDTLFVLVTPTVSVHLQMLARLAALVQDDAVKRLLKERADIDAIVREAERVEQQGPTAPDHKRAG